MMLAWAQLVRLPNVFTVLADVGAAFLFVAGGPQPLIRWVLILLAGVSFYWAGMVLNDLFDLQQDRQQRPNRPLPAGQIPLGQAKIVGWGLLAGGIVLATASGIVPSERFAMTWLPAVTGLLLALAIVAYDGPLKKTPLAPVAMGSCRFLSFLLGASPCLVAATDQLLFPRHLLASALGFGVYISGITTIAQDEAGEKPGAHLIRGLVISMLGAGMLAFAPQTAEIRGPWYLSPEGQFPILIGLIIFPVLVRGVRQISQPTAPQVQMLVRIGILTMIPLAAAYAFLGAGPVWAIVIFSLAGPAIMLANRFRVT